MPLLDRMLFAIGFFAAAIGFALVACEVWAKLFGGFSIP